MINSRTFACEVTPLTNRSWDATETDDHHHIRMRTTDEFFGLDHNDYVYEGYTKVREVPADIFSRLRPSRRHPGRNVSILRKDQQLTPSYFFLRVSKNASNRA